jgi:hypothetical protein
MLNINMINKEMLNGNVDMYKCRNVNVEMLM